MCSVNEQVLRFVSEMENLQMVLSQIYSIIWKNLKRAKQNQHMMQCMAIDTKPYKLDLKGEFGKLAAETDFKELKDEWVEWV